MIVKWLISMVIVNPQDLWLWDPFQMAMKLADKMADNCSPPARGTLGECTGR